MIIIYYLSYALPLDEKNMEKIIGEDPISK